MQRPSKSIHGGWPQPLPLHSREEVFDHLRRNLRNRQASDFGIEDVTL
jgi:hypothetical protein